MPDTDYRAETILAVDFGTATTRTSLFDVVEGVFRHVASAEAPSTLQPPYSDASEGMRHALSELQAITGRHMLNDAARLIMPAGSDGNGTDVFVATSSGGPLLRAVLVGLLPEVSLASARRVAESVYLSVVDTLSLTDRRRTEQQIDAIVSAKPQVVIIAGGTDGGASEAVLKLAEAVGLGCYRLPPEPRVHVVFMGNSLLQDKIMGMLSNLASVSVAPNVQPELGQESLGAARAELGRVYQDVRFSQVGGMHELFQYSAGHFYPTAQAEAQMIRFLSKSLGSKRGLLSVNVGSASTTLAAAFSGEVILTVAPDLGIGVNAANVMKSAALEKLARWTPGDGSAAELRNFIHYKTVAPHTVPADLDDLHREFALARQAMRGVLKRARAQWPASAPGPRADLMPWCDLIIGGGAVLGHAPSAGAAALLLLDGLEPTGITNLALDRHHLLASLGAVAYVNPLAATQVLERDALLDLGMAISVVGSAREGDTVCDATLVNDAGVETKRSIKYGSLEVLHLPLGRTGKLSLRPRAGMDIGKGPGRGWKSDVIGSVVGIIIDARGRPLALPTSSVERAEKLQAWLSRLAEA